MEPSLQHGHRPAAEVYPTVVQPNAQDSAARRRLVGAQGVLAESLAPIGSEHAVGGTGHRILGDPNPRGKESRHEIVLGPVPRGGDDDAAGVQRRHSRKIRGKGHDLLRAREHGQHITAGAADPFGRRPQGLDQCRARGRGGRRLRRKIQTHRSLFAGRGQNPAASVKRQGRCLDVARLPQHVGRRQGRVAAQIDLDGGREPAQPPFRRSARDQEGGLRQVHLRGHLLLPLGRDVVVQQADCGRIAGERCLGKGIHHEHGLVAHWRDSEAGPVVPGRPPRGAATRPRAGKWMITLEALAVSRGAAATGGRAPRPRAAAVYYSLGRDVPSEAACSATASRADRTAKVAGVAARAPGLT